MRLFAIAPDGVSGELRRLYYDTANSLFPQNMAALLKFAPVTQALFGSDTPYVAIATNVGNIDKVGLSASELAAIERGNALRLFPRMAG